MTIRSDYVNLNSGLISRDIFIREDLYLEERERVFRRAWLYIGHESQIPEAGDFILSKMGEESVILARGNDDQVRVLLNSCRHRGMRVCRYDEGRTQKFFCPYHGWSYNLDGSLAFVTSFESDYTKAPFEWENWGLVQVAKVAIIRGMVWATWDAEAPDFDEYLGGAKKLLDLSFCAWDGLGEVEVLGSTQKWIIPSNWKIVAENFAGDMLHMISHRSVDIVGINPGGTQGRRDENTSFKVQASYPGGHASVVSVFNEGDPRREYANSPVTAEYFQACLEKRREVLSDDDVRFAAGVGTIFPNMSFHGNQPRSILVAHPLGPAKTEMWRQYFVDKHAPADVKKFLRSYYLRYSGPAGMTEQDDMENWNYATVACDGTVSRDYPYNYMSGMGFETSHPAVPGGIWSGTRDSETNARAFYARWQQYMNDQRPVGARADG